MPHPRDAATRPASAAARILQSCLDLRTLGSFWIRANADRGRERYRRAGLTASTSLLSQGLAILISLISVPLTVRYLGAERYGVWLTISSLLTWMAITDFGLAGNALVNLISEANGNDDRELAREYAASAFWALTSITVSVGTVFLVTFHRIPWRAVFRVSGSMSPDELQQACALTLAVFVLGFPLNMLNSLYNGYQDGLPANLWTIAGNTLALVSLVVVTQFRGGLPQLVFALSGTRVLVSFANGYYVFFHRYPWLAPVPSAVRWIRVKRLAKLGAKYMVTQLAGLGIYQSQPLIITQVLGPAKVMIFVVAQKVLTLPHGLVFMATQPLVAAYAEARARGDWKWIRNALRHSMLVSLGFGIVITTAAALVARPLIRVWAGAAAVPDTTLVVWLSIYALVGIATLPPAQMLNGLERVGRPAIGLTLCAALTIGLGIVFVRSWGLTGLAVAMSGGLAITYCIVLAVEVRRVLRTSRIRVPALDACEETVSV